MNLQDFSWKCVQKSTELGTKFPEIRKLLNIFLPDIVIFPNDWHRELTNIVQRIKLDYSLCRFTKKCDFKLSWRFESSILTESLSSAEGLYGLYKLFIFNHDSLKYIEISLGLAYIIFRILQWSNHIITTLERCSSNYTL